jgi:osmotically-inducible protein OsmY
MDVKKKIEDALRRRLEGEIKGIHITVQDGNKVLLEGFVDSWEELHAVELAAWSAPGVKAVEDRLSIGA